MNPGHAYSDAVVAKRDESYRLEIAAFVRWCAANGVSPRPASSTAIAAFLGTLEGLRGSAVAVYCNAIRWWHVRDGFADPTRSKDVRSMREAAARVPKQPLPPPIGADEIRRALSVLDPEQPTDARGALTILLASVGGIIFQRIAAADRSRTRFVEDGVVLGVRGGEHFVGAGSAPLTDPAWWVRRWLDHVGTEPGPLLVARGLRGGWGRTPLRERTAARELHAIWDRAGIEGPLPTFGRLRRGFALAAIRHASPVVVAHQVGAHSIRALDRNLHLPGIAKDNHWAHRAKLNRQAAGSKR